MCTPKNNINFISIFLKKQTTNNSLTMSQQITFFLNPHPLKSLTLCSASIPVLPFYFGPPLCLPLISCCWTLHSVLPFCLISVRFILSPSSTLPSQHHYLSTEWKLFCWNFGYRALYASKIVFFCLVRYYF